MPLLGERFRRRAVLKLLTPKVHRSYQNQFLKENDPLTENFENFVAKRFTGTWIHVFLTSFTEIGKAEVTERVRSIRYEKKVGILPPHLGLLERFRHKLYRITLSPFPIPLPSFVQTVRCIGKCLPDSLQHRREARRLLVDNKDKEMD